jgi:SAM-dependent methyltransferase
VCSQPVRAPRCTEATIEIVTTARYDGLAEWYDREFAGDGPPRRTVMELLGDGPGLLLDVGCGTGTHSAAFSEHGWSVLGVDISEDLLERARARGVHVVNADAAALPFDDSSFDAAVSMWTHTDVDDFSAVLREIARVLRADGAFVYLGAHPCFVGPHSLFVAAEGVPEFHSGFYRRAERYTEAPGVSPSGLRARVGATHLPLGPFVQAFVDAGFRLERIEEPEAEGRDFPYMLALRWRQ